MSNRIHEAFDAVRADGELISSTQAFLMRERRRRQKARGLRFAVMTACCAAVLALCIGGYMLVSVPVAFISIDVNPSIELSLNRIDRVIACTAYNADGQTVLNGVSLNGQTYTNAIDTLMGSPGMREYTENAQPVFTVAAETEAKQKSVMDDIESHSDHQAQYASTTTATRTRAHACGMSMGKYTAYLALAAYDPSLTVDECRDMTIAEIHDEINGHESGHCETPAPSGQLTQIATAEPAIAVTPSPSPLPAATPAPTEKCESGSGKHEGNHHKEGHD